MGTQAHSTSMKRLDRDPIFNSLQVIPWVLTRMYRVKRGMLFIRLLKMHIFYFQHSVEDVVPKCEVIHISLVCAGYNSTRSVVTLIKSVLFYRHHPIHFHFVTDEPSKNILNTLFKTWILMQGV